MMRENTYNRKISSVVGLVALLVLIIFVLKRTFYQLNLGIPIVDISHSIQDAHISSNLTNIKNCIEDLKNENGDIILPNLKDKDLKIPFYIFPEGLPNEEEISWSDCWKQYLDRVHDIKKKYGYYVAKQLENHLWRVDSPEKAVLYVSPYLDFEPYSNPLNGCEEVFNPKPTHELMAILYDKYSEYINRHNTLWLMGGWQNFGDYKDFILKNKSDQEIAEAVLDPRISPLLMTFQWRADLRYWKPNQLSMTIPVVNACRYDDDAPAHDQKICDDVERHLERDETLTREEWLESRPVAMSYFGKQDGRCNYFTRRYFRWRIEDLVTDELNDNTRKWLNMDPFIFANRERVSEPGAIHKTGVIPARSIIGQQNPPDYDAFLETWNKAAHDNLTVKDQLTSGVIWFSDLSDMQTALPFEDQILLRLKSKFVISLRGDAAHSQRTWEGLYFGSLAIHDMSERLYSFLTPLPYSLPWRLMGIFSNELVEFLQKEYLLFSTWAKMALSIPDHEKTQAFFKLFEPLLGLINSDDISIMLKAIRKYRKQVLWNVENSELAENLLFEAARMMFKNKDYHDTADKFNIDLNWFETNFPKSCLLDDGQSPYEAVYHMDYTNPERLSRLKEIIEEAEHYKNNEGWLCGDWDDGLLANLAGKIVGW